MEVVFALDDCTLLSWFLMLLLHTFFHTYPIHFERRLDLMNISIASLNLIKTVNLCINYCHIRLCVYNISTSQFKWAMVILIMHLCVSLCVGVRKVVVVVVVTI